MNTVSTIYEDTINFYHNNFSVEWDEDTKTSLYDFLVTNNFSEKEILFCGLCFRKKIRLEDNISKTTVNELRIGYANTDVQCLYDFLLSKGYTVDEILSSGLCLEDDGCIKDAFFRSVVFPVYNFKKELLALIGKRIDKGFNQNAYTIVYSLDSSSAEDEFFCFDYDGDKRGYCIICDNYFDLIYLYDLGVKNAVSFFGNNLNLTKEQLQVIKISNNIVRLKIDLVYRREEMRDKLKKHNILIL